VFIWGVKMAKKNLFIEKPDGLRLVIPNDKFLAAWVVGERAILGEKQNIANQIDQLKTQAQNTSAESLDAINAQIAQLNNMVMDLRPYGILLYGYEKAHEQLQMVRITDNIESIYNALPNKDDYKLCKAEGGFACLRPSAIVQAEELLLPAIVFDDIELLEAKLTSVALVYGEEHNQRQINVLVETPIEEIMP